jgi:hypothetical protein
MSLGMSIHVPGHELAHGWEPEYNKYPDGTSKGTRPALSRP